MLIKTNIIELDFAAMYFRIGRYDLHLTKATAGKAPLFRITPLEESGYCIRIASLLVIASAQPKPLHAF
ncbi:MAG: hypothetical protein SFW64_03640 [Alphaproteobacteria bacterium]|nr:hypothetical protein [Alphaproteobacteria bacterium]